jgi:hypothetical protein
MDGPTVIVIVVLAIVLGAGGFFMRFGGRS